MRSLIVFFAAALMASGAAADGKFYGGSVPPGIPFQRAILTWDGKLEVLTIETKFEAREGQRFGWVIPVPAVPEIASPEPQSLDFRYGRLERETRTTMIGWGDGVLGLLALGYLYLLYLCWKRQRWGAFAFLAVLVPLLAAVAFPAYQGVQVIKEERAGPYEATVIRGDSGAEIVAWLTENGFRFDERDREVFGGYVARGWVFVAAKLDAGAKGAARGVMAPPLHLAFPAAQAVYPLALTATAGQTVEVLLYVYAPNRMDAGPLPLRYSKRLDERTQLSKFSGKLNPEQMRNDLYLQRAPSDASFGRWAFDWRL